MDIKQILITKIGTKPFTTKKGDQIKKVGLQCKEYADQWLTSFVWKDDNPCLTWRAGDMVEVVIQHNGQYINFNIPTRLDRLEARVERLEAKPATGGLTKNPTPPQTIPGAEEPSLGDESVSASPEDAFDNESLPF